MIASGTGMTALRDGFGGLGYEVLYQARVQCPLRLQLLWPLQPIGRKASARETEREDKCRLYAAVFTPKIQQACQRAVLYGGYSNNVLQQNRSSCTRGRDFTRRIALAMPCALRSHQTKLGVATILARRTEVSHVADTLDYHTHSLKTERRSSVQHW